LIKDGDDPASYLVEYPIQLLLQVALCCEGLLAVFPLGNIEADAVVGPELVGIGELADAVARVTHHLAKSQTRLLRWRLLLVVKSREDALLARIQPWLKSGVV